MRTKQIFITFLILIASIQICFSQEIPKAELVDEFGNISCNDFLARADFFFITLHNEPGSHGFMVVSGENTLLRRKLVYELWMKGAIHFRKFDIDRITFIRSEEAGDLRIQFWKVPTGAEKPDFKETNWNFVFSPETRPFIFYNDNEHICSSVGFERIFAEYLNSNPQARGHIVIYENSMKEYAKQKRETQNLLKAIPSNRLKYFYAKAKYSYIEYWLVPRKKKQMLYD